MARGAEVGIVFLRMQSFRERRGKRRFIAAKGRAVSVLRLLPGHAVARGAVDALSTAGDPPGAMRS